jgi:hypothetical protein
MSLNYKTLKLRLIKIVLSTGHIEVLASSLIDSQAFPTQDFGEL